MDVSSGDLSTLVRAEAEDEASAIDMASDEELADSIAAEALSGATEDLTVEAEQDAAAAALFGGEGTGEELESSPVYDLVSLCDKYGGLQQIYDDHGVAASQGFFSQMENLKDWLFDFVGEHNKTARQSYLEFEHAARGSRLVLLGTNHLSRSSSSFAEETVLAERPDCLVLERRLGDDSLQRFTVPESLIMEQLGAPSVLRTSDTPIERARKFQLDKIWLESSPAWRDIGGEAALCHEFGAALGAFARLRLESESDSGSGRGGSVCLADSDLRGISSKGIGMLPGLDNLGKGTCMPVRDLQLAQALRAALRTHKRVVGVVGQGHLAGISRLLLQDPQIRSTGEGLPPGEPIWLKDLEEGGKRWEREAVGGSPLLTELVKALERVPLGTFLSADAAKRLYLLREETAERLKRDGPDGATPAAAVSSELGADFFRRGQAYAPPDEASLVRWLAGRETGVQEAGEFPFENRRLRAKAPPLAGSGFPEDPSSS